MKCTYVFRIPTEHSRVFLTEINNFLCELFEESLEKFDNKLLSLGGANQNATYIYIYITWQF